MSEDVFGCHNLEGVAFRGWKPAMLLNTHSAQGAPAPPQENSLTQRSALPRQRGQAWPKRVNKGINEMNKCGNSFECPPLVMNVRTVQRPAAHLQATGSPASLDSPSCRRECSSPGNTGTDIWAGGGGTTCLWGHESDAQAG